LNRNNHTTTIRIFAFLLIIINSISAQGQKTTVKDLFVNDSIPAIVELDKLRRMVEIDSITIKPEIMDAIDPDSLVYIGETYFLYYKGNNVCYLSKVEFNKKIKSIRIDQYTFDNQSTYAELKSAFSSCSVLSDKISVHNDPLNYESCSIDIEDYDGRFLFFFYEKKLKLFFLWQPT
jgi:hypothetical protein